MITQGKPQLTVEAKPSRNLKGSLSIIGAMGSGILSICTLGYTIYGDRSTDAKIDKALDMAQKALNQQELARRGDPLLLEQDTILKVDSSLIGDGKPNTPPVMTIRNLGGDSVTGVYVAWQPMYPPIPKEAPDVNMRLEIVKQLAKLELAHSKLSGNVIAPNEVVVVQSLPDMFQVCFQFPGVKFYGEMTLGWKNRIIDELMGASKSFMYCATTVDGKLSLEIASGCFPRGWVSEFNDPLFFNTRFPTLPSPF